MLANDSDSDGDTLNVVSVTQGANGTVSINPDKTVRYAPALNFFGSESFTYTVDDGHGGSDSHCQRDRQRRQRCAGVYD